MGRGPGLPIRRELTTTSFDNHVHRDATESEELELTQPWRRCGADVELVALSLDARMCLRRENISMACPAHSFLVVFHA